MEHLSHSPFSGPGRAEELGTLAMLEWFLLGSLWGFLLRSAEWIWDPISSNRRSSSRGWGVIHKNTLTFHIRSTRGGRRLFKRAEAKETTLDQWPNILLGEGTRLATPKTIYAPNTSSLKPGSGATEGVLD